MSSQVFLANPSGPFSFGRKWALFVVLAAILVTFAVLASLIYRSVDRELTGLALLRRESVANLAAATLGEKLARLVDIGTSLSTPVRFRQLAAEGEWAEAMETLRDVPRDFPLVDRVLLADAQGTIVADYPALAGTRGDSFAHRDWYKGVSRGWRPYVSEVYSSASTPRRNVFTVAVPIRKPGPGVAGILALQIRLDGTFFEWTRDIDLGAGGAVHVVDQAGQAAFSSTSLVRGEIADLSAKPAVQQLRAGKEGVYIAVDSAGKEETILAFAGVQPYGWGVVTEQPAGTAAGLMARGHQLRRLMVMFGLLLLSSASMVYLAHRIVVQRGLAREGRLAQAELERCVAERTAQLETANKELESFSYSVSHDLRGPLRSMDGFSQVLIEDYGDKLDEEGRDALERIRAASQRMGSLIDDMLRLSHVTRSELDIRPVDLGSVAREIAEGLAREDPDRAVDWSIEPALGISADPALIRIAMQNLLQNAWKFTRRTARAAIRVGALERGGKRTYFVADNGVGFDPAHAGNLFGAFQRLHDVSEFPGSGIGLAIVQRIIHRHEGQIRAEAKEGEGATFYFTVKESECQSP